MVNYHADVGGGEGGGAVREGPYRPVMLCLFQYSMIESGFWLEKIHIKVFPSGKE